MPYEVSIYKALMCVAEGSVAVGAASVNLPVQDLDKARGGEIEVLLGVETDQIRMSLSGQAATATSMLYDIGDKIRIAGPANVRNLRMIQVTGASVVRYQVFGKAI